MSAETFFLQMRKHKPGANQRKGFFPHRKNNALLKLVWTVFPDYDGQTLPNADFRPFRAPLSTCPQKCVTRDFSQFGQKNSCLECAPTQLCENFQKTNKRKWSLVCQQIFVNLRTTNFISSCCYVAGVEKRSSEKNLRTERRVPPNTNQFLYHIVVESTNLCVRRWARK